MEELQFKHIGYTRSGLSAQVSIDEANHRVRVSLEDTRKPDPHKSTGLLSFEFPAIVGMGLIAAYKQDPQLTNSLPVHFAEILELASELLAYPSSMIVNSSENTNESTALGVIALFILGECFGSCVDVMRQLIEMQQSKQANVDHIAQEVIKILADSALRQASYISGAKRVTEVISNKKSHEVQNLKDLFES